MAIPSVPDKPRPNVRDRARTVGEAAIAAVPVAGGPLVVLLEGLVRPSYDKRLDEWLEHLAEVVRELESRALGASKISEADEVFVSAVVKATQVALGTHVKEKLTLLRRALVHLGSEFDGDDFLAIRYLGFIDELAPEHVQVLSYAVAPMDWHQNWGENDSATPRALLGRAHLSVRRELLDLLLADLAARYLIRPDEISLTARGSVAVRPFATSLGRGFIEFIQEKETVVPLTD